MAGVVIQEQGPIAGVWAECDKGAIGLMAQDGASAYLVLYGKSDGQVSGAPELAISTGDVGDGAAVQIPGPDGSYRNVRMIPLTQLLAAIADLISPSA